MLSALLQGTSQNTFKYESDCHSDSNDITVSEFRQNFGLIIHTNIDFIYEQNVRYVLNFTLTDFKPLWGILDILI